MIKNAWGSGSVSIRWQLLHPLHICNTLQPHKLKMAVANIPVQAQNSGYDFSFTKPVPDRFNCNICTKVLRDPHLTFCCGQHFCEFCLNHWFKKQKTTCPHCRHENFNHVLNKALKREIDDLEIRCTKQGLGCQWVGELNCLQTHLDSEQGCRCVEVQCSKKCGAKMKRKELKAHLERQCPLRKIQCQYCHYEDAYQTITNKHYGECPHYPLPCPNKCGTTGIRRADMDNHLSRCELETMECPFHEAGCKVHVVRKEFDSHMSGNQQNHLLVLLGAYQETKRELEKSQTKLVENRRELDESKRKLHNTSLKLLETRKEMEESKPKPAKQMTLKHDGNGMTFCMNDYSLYKHTGRVWHSPPFYYQGGYKLCLAVYANGKGAGAGTHVSAELLQMKGEHDDKLRWDRGYEYPYYPWNISIQMMVQNKKAWAPEKEISLESHFCSSCFTRLPPPKGLRVFKPCFSNAASTDKFIDHQSAEQVMVVNDTIALRVSCTNC